VYSIDQGESWERAQGMQGKVNMVTHSKADAKTVYAATQEQNYRSQNGGLKWQPIWDNIPSALTLNVLDTDPEFIYAGTSKGLYKSFNQGRSWIRDSSKKIKTVRSLFVSPLNISHIYLATDDGLWFTKNGGDSWAPVHRDKSSIIKTLSLPQATALTHIATLSSPTLFLGTSRGLFVSSDRGKEWQPVDLAVNADAPLEEERKMDMVKLITEIHTGRFFGSYFFLLVDLATLGLVILVVSGIFIGVYRQQAKTRKKVSMTDDLATDRILDIRETASDLASESQDIHDMVEHISNHLEKCKTIYQSREKKEVQEMGRHITTLDKKLHTLMARLEEMENFQQN
jgi:hypothetical protein